MEAAGGAGGAGAHKMPLGTRWAQMSRQEQLIERKKQEIQLKLQAQRQAAALSACARAAGQSNVKEEKGKVNIFSNDGSFMDQFKKLLENQQQEDKAKQVNIKAIETDASDDADGHHKRVEEPPDLKEDIREPAREPSSSRDWNERRQSTDRALRDSKTHRWSDDQCNQAPCRSPPMPEMEDRNNTNKLIPSLMQFPVMPPGGEQQEPTNDDGPPMDQWSSGPGPFNMPPSMAGPSSLPPFMNGPPNFPNNMPPSFPGPALHMGPNGPMPPFFGPPPPNMMGPTGPPPPNMMGPNGPPPPNMMGPNGPPQPNMMGPNGPPPNMMGPNGPMPPNRMGPNGPLPPNIMMGPNGPLPPTMMGPNGPPRPNMMGPNGPPLNMLGPNGPPPRNMMAPNGPPPPNMMRPNCPIPPHMMGPNGPLLPNMMPSNGPPPPNMMRPNGPRQPNMMGLNGPPPPNMMGPNRPPLPNLMGPNGPPLPNMMGPNGPPPPNMMGPNGPIPPNMMGPNGPPPPNMIRPNRPPPSNMMGPNGPPPPNMMGPRGPNMGNMPFMRPPFGMPNGPPNPLGFPNIPPNLGGANMPFLPPPSMPSGPESKPLEVVRIPPPEPMKIQNIPPPASAPLTHISKPKDPNLGEIPSPTSPVLSAGGSSVATSALERVAKEVALNGDHWESVLKAISSQDQNMWFLHNVNSPEYKQYKELVSRHRCDQPPTEDVKPEDKYDPEFGLEDEDSDGDQSCDVKESSFMKSGTKWPTFQQTESEIKEERQSNSDDDEETQRERRKRKRKSRWGEESDEAKHKILIPAITTMPILPGLEPPAPPLPPMPPMPGAPRLAPVDGDGAGIKLTAVNRSNHALLQYATTNYGSTNLSPEDWKKCEDNFKLNLLYQDMLRKRQEVERLAAAGKHKYEYDSDEDTEAGTWEHKCRAREMNATERWADELTKQAAGKHHIGDFLPPEELKKFMEKYSAMKGGKEPDLSDYKEFKLKEDNIGFKMLQKLGWNEGQGLGAEGTGIVDPVNKSNQSGGNSGLGAATADNVSPDDDEFDAYRKRMMLAYRFRPNPLNNPRRPYY